MRCEGQLVPDEQPECLGQIVELLLGAVSDAVLAVEARLPPPGALEIVADPEAETAEPQSAPVRWRSAGLILRSAATVSVSQSTSPDQYSRSSGWTSASTMLWYHASSKGGSSSSAGQKKLCPISNPGPRLFWSPAMVGWAAFPDRYMVVFTQHNAFEVLGPATGLLVG